MTSGRPVRLVLALAIATLLLGPVTQAAWGATVVRSGSEIFFTAPAGQTNDITVTRDGTDWVFTDVGTPVTAFGAGCAYTTSISTARCVAGSGDSIAIDAGDMDDSVDVSAVDVKASLCGGTGSDVVVGGRAGGLVVGGSDDDLLVGGAGFDAIHGEGFCLNDNAETPGDDVILAGADDDFLRGNAGSDLLQAGAGQDTVVGDGGDDVLDGEAGDDLVLGLDGDDRLFGGEGADNIGGGLGQDQLVGGPGNDLLGVVFGLSGQVISTEGGDDTLDGGAGDDKLNGGPGANAVNRDDPFDQLPGITETAGNGRDTLFGGEGSDTVTYEKRLLPVTVTLDGSSDDGSPGEGDRVGADVETVIGGSLADTLSAGGLGVTLDGGPGADTLTGGPGRDKLTGGTDDDANDLLSGGAGVDTLAGGGGDDEITGGSGNDGLDGGGGADYADGGTGRDELSGGNGTDILRARGTGSRAACGPGTDYVLLGTGTRVQGDCEQTERSFASRLGGRIAVRRMEAQPLFQPPGVSRFAPVLDIVRIPFGSIVEPGTGGSVQLTPDRRARGRRATVGGAAFLISVGRSRDIATVRLRDAPGACPRAAAAFGPSLSVTAKGGIVVAGRYSRARGSRATWTTEERCAGTLTVVKRGRVTAVDKRRGRKVILQPGRRHLARG